MSPNRADSPLPIVVLISGGGTTLRNLIEQQAQGLLRVRIQGVISSNSRAGGLEYARLAEIPSTIIRRESCDDDAEFSRKVFAACRSWRAELVVMGGFLKRLPIAPDFVNRVVNIHPSLVPAFCGHGYYGIHVHRAVLEYGAKVSGCTVHFVDEQYDHGPVILQRVVPVLDNDTPEELAQRVFAEECRALPEALNLLADGKLVVQGRRVRQRQPDESG